MVVAESLSVRLDAESSRALARLEASGLTRSQAIRRALIEAADRMIARAALAAEVAALEADDDDRREMREVAEFMEGLRASR